jgi:hypothetical protein
MIRWDRSGERKRRAAEPMPRHRRCRYCTLDQLRLRALLAATVLESLQAHRVPHLVYRQKAAQLGMTLADYRLACLDLADSGLARLTPGPGGLYVHLV